MVDPKRAKSLSIGKLATRNLQDMLAIDFPTLFASALPEAKSLARRRFEPGLGITRRMELGGAMLLEVRGLTGALALATHESDTVRGWVGYAIGMAEDLTLEDRLAAIRPLADDPHFGVREWAWMGIRTPISAELPRALKLFTPWSSDPSTNIRRFGSEATRPRGVWCAHLVPLKSDPSPGLPILEPLRADPTKYVQDSVSNWLNDASKTSSQWVRELCARWRRESPGKVTDRICRRALRTLEKTPGLP